MGVEQHHAVLYGHWDPAVVAEAHAAARRIFPSVTDIVRSERNGWSWFMVPPDGSKDGWDASRTGDERRRTFLAEHGGVEVAWGEVTEEKQKTG